MKILPASNLFLFLAFCASFANAQVVFKDTTQEKSAKDSKAQFTAGVGFGYASPSELNSYIQQELTTRWMVSGSTDLNLYVLLDAAIWIPVAKQLSVGPLIEGAVASRSFQDISANMETYVYSLWRFSPGVGLQYLIPLHNSYWYFSPAYQYHSLKYNGLVGPDIKEKTSGFRLEVGLATIQWSLDLRYRLVATLMSTGNEEQPDLNFSGVGLGIGIGIP